LSASKKNPETMHQALEWDRSKKRYLNLGLCHRCAAQAAWGHQCGFSLIEPPCSTCVPVVATLPQPATKGSGWRKATREGLKSLSRGACNVGGTVPRYQDTHEAPQPEFA